MITAVRSGLSLKATKVNGSDKVEDTSLLGLLTPIADMTQLSDEGEKKRQNAQYEAAEAALKELEEKYTEMVNAIDTDNINLEENYVKGYITRMEKRRGGPYSKSQRQRFLAVAKQARETDDKELAKILALELCIGISPKMEKSVLAAFGNVFIHHRDASTVLKGFLKNEKCNPNLAAYAKTLVMLNRVEAWMGKVETIKHRIKAAFSPEQWLAPPSSN